MTALEHAGRPVEDTVSKASTLQDALEAILTDDDGLAAVHYHPSAWIDPDDDPDGPEAC